MTRASPSEAAGSAVATQAGFDLSAVGASVQAGDPDRFEAALFADASVRERLFALYAFNLEAARIPWKVSEPQIGVVRLKWLLDVIANAANGGAPMAHEMAEPFHVALRETATIAGGRPLDRATLDGLVEARVRDLDPDPHSDWDALKMYLTETAGGLMRLATHVAAGRETAQQARAATALGVAHGAAAMIEATPELASRGRVLLPDAPGEPPIDGEAMCRGETPPGAHAALAQLAQIGQESLRDAERLASDLPQSAFPACLAAWRSRRVFNAVVTRNFDMVRDLGPESPFRRRASLLWRGLRGRWR